MRRWVSPGRVGSFVRRWVSPGRVAFFAVLLLAVGLGAFGAHQIIQQQRAACGVWRDLGSVPVSEAQSEIGRKILIDAKRAADALDCP